MSDPDKDDDGRVRRCAACLILAAMPYDRYCEGCGSALDRDAWAWSGCHGG